MGGGVTLDNFPKMPKKKFLWLLKRMRAQIKSENDALRKKTNIGPTKAPSGKMKYLGV